MNGCKKNILLCQRLEILQEKKTNRSTTMLTFEFQCLRASAAASPIEVKKIRSPGSAVVGLPTRWGIFDRVRLPSLRPESVSDLSVFLSVTVLLGYLVRVHTIYSQSCFHFFVRPHV